MWLRRHKVNGPIPSSQPEGTWPCWVWGWPPSFQSGLCWTALQGRPCPSCCISLAAKQNPLLNTENGLNNSAFFCNYHLIKFQPFVRTKSTLTPTDEVQAHHMSTDWSHLKANRLALEASSVLVDRTRSIEASPARTASFSPKEDQARKYHEIICKFPKLICEGPAWQICLNLCVF